jgi:OOP family OmpA-OmpF porin
MKKNLLCCVVAFSMIHFYSISAFAQIDIFGKVKSAINNEGNKKTDKAIDDALHPKPKADTTHVSGTNSSTSSASATASATTGTAANIGQSYKAYQNFDFKAGDTVIFEDLFRDDQDGEFPAHWDLDRGQAVINKVQGEPAFCLTEGNYVIVTPRMKTQSYLSDPFTIEFDYLANNGYPPLLRFADASGSNHDLHFGQTVSSGGFKKDLAGSEVSDNNSYNGKWHHAALIYKNDQLKAYVDNVRALVMPHCEFKPVRVQVCGIGDQNKPITFKNFRIASGGSQNMIGKLLTDGKFVTHGITFDIGKATLKPESMGVLNDIVKFMNDNTSTKFEIDGHTDSDGNGQSNQILSEDRAAAVKTQLVAMGIDPLRLSAKGFGASKPLAPNDSPEAKANNRRVEFVKI